MAFHNGPFSIPTESRHLLMLRFSPYSVLRACGVDDPPKIVRVWTEPSGDPKDIQEVRMIVEDDSFPLVEPAEIVPEGCFRTDDEGTTVVPIRKIGYKNRPVVVDAYQMTTWDIKMTAICRPDWPDWLFYAWCAPRDAIGALWHSATGERMLLRTPTGVVFVTPGDWIVKDTQGELSVCSNYIFDKTYEAVWG